MPGLLTTSPSDEGYRAWAQPVLDYDDVLSGRVPMLSRLDGPPGGITPGSAVHTSTDLLDENNTWALCGSAATFFGRHTPLDFARRIAAAVVEAAEPELVRAADDGLLALVRQSEPSHAIIAPIGLKQRVCPLPTRIYYSYGLDPNELVVVRRGDLRFYFAPPVGLAYQMGMIRLDVDCTVWTEKSQLDASRVVFETPMAVLVNDLLADPALDRFHREGEKPPPYGVRE